MNTGSHFETFANFGVLHMVSFMFYHSTAHLCHLHTVKTLEQFGCERECRA